MVPRCPLRITRPVSSAGSIVSPLARSSPQRRPRSVVYGAGLFGPMLHWTATYVGAAPWLILVFSQTWFLALLGAALPVVQRLRFGSVLSAALWVLRMT